MNAAVQSCGRSTSSREHPTQTPMVVSITNIEDLSNEIFYELFDYLDDCDVYQSFSDLNGRFQKLLACLDLRLKVKISQLPEEDRSFQRHTTGFYSTQRRIPANFSIFQQLESLRSIDIHSKGIVRQLSMLRSFPRLLSLSIRIEGELKSLTGVYKLIFSLPSLKHVKISYNQYNPYIPLAMAGANPCSSIEHLNIDHSCRLKNLMAMLSYTPALSHLTCKSLIDWDESFQDMLVSRPKLTHVAVRTYFARFDEFDMFTRTISRHLQVLRVSVHSTKAYLDADQWQRFISEHVPRLHRFYLRHEQMVGNEFNVTDFCKSIALFNTPFWTERQWIPNLSITIAGAVCQHVTFCITPCSKMWNQTCSSVAHRSPESDSVLPSRAEDTVIARYLPTDRQFYNTFPLAELVLKANALDHCTHSFLDTVLPSFEMIKITHLNIQHDQFSAKLLLQLLWLLPHLTSIELKSLSRTLSSYGDQYPHVLPTKFHTINKVSLASITHLTEVQFLIDLCPNIQQLQICCTADIETHSLIRLVLINNYPSLTHLNVLRLSSPTADDKLIDELQRILHQYTALMGYTVRRAVDQVHVQWR